MTSEKKAFLKPISLLDRAIEFFEKVVLSLGVIVMATINIANVIGRNLFDYSLTFVDETNQVLLVLITFLGIGYAARYARHIRMSAFYDPLPPMARKVLMIIMSLATSALLFLLAWYAYGYMQSTRTIGTVTPALQLPLYLVYLWVPVGFVLGGVQFLLTAIRNLSSPGVYLAYHEPEGETHDVDVAKSTARAE